MVKYFLMFCMLVQMSLVHAADVFAGTAPHEELRASMLLNGISQHVVTHMLKRIARESEFEPKSENLNYPSVDQVRRVFGKTVAALTDHQIASRFVRKPRALGDYVYRSIGGYRYRGRGYIQLSGIANYRQYSQLIFGDNRLVRNPDLANRHDVAVRILVEYTHARVTQVAQERWGKDLEKLNHRQAFTAVHVAMAGREIRPARKTRV
jgi:predicted chitinase